MRRWSGILHTGVGLRTGNRLSDPVLGPAAVDLRAHLGAHLDLLGPRAGVLLGELVGRVDAELAPVELPSGRVVEVVERALA